MLTITEVSPNRLNIDLSGALDADAMREGLDQLVEAAKDMTDGKMLYTINDFELPTLGALAVELQQMPRLFGLLKKINKCAVLSDASWIRTAAEIEGAVIPGLEIKSFALADAAAAEIWLGGTVDEEEDDEDENFPV